MSRPETRGFPESDDLESYGEIPSDPMASAEPFASLRRPGLSCHDRSLRIPQFDPTGHLDGIVAEEERDPAGDMVFGRPPLGIHKLDIGHAFSIDTAAKAQESRPSPTAKVGPRAAMLRLVTTTSASSTGTLPAPVRSLDCTEDVLPGPLFGVFKLDRQHRASAFDPLLQDADRFRTRLERVPAPVDSRAWPKRCSLSILNRRPSCEGLRVYMPLRTHDHLSPRADDRTGPAQ
jgi:hypothetical protein